MFSVYMHTRDKIVELGTNLSRIVECSCNASTPTVGEGLLPPDGRNGIVQAWDTVGERSHATGVVLSHMVWELCRCQSVISSRESIS